MGIHELAAFEKAVIDQAPRGALVVGVSLSPDAAYGAALTFLPTADYLMEDAFERDGDQWELTQATTGTGTYWAPTGEGERGVLRYADEAPRGASVARVEYDGQEHRVSVRHGHFYFVAWDVASPGTEPSLISFE